MDLVSVVLSLAVVGLIVWAATTLVPMPAQFKTLIYVVAIVACCLWLLSLIPVAITLPGVR